MLKRGLVLMVGATGSGKSTTLAAMINHRNENSSDHILTIEDPIEFLHRTASRSSTSAKSASTRKSFSRALRSAMRAAPDVILIGEIRDRETDGVGDHARRHRPPGASRRCTRTTAPKRSTASSTCSRATSTRRSSSTCRSTCARSSRSASCAGNNKRVAAVEVLLNTPHVQDLIKKGDVIGVKEAMLHVEREGHAELRHGAVRALSRRGHHARGSDGAMPIRARTSKRRSTSADGSPRLHAWTPQTQRLRVEHRSIDAHALHRRSRGV